MRKSDVVKRIVYDWLLGPKGTDEDSRRSEFIVNVIILGSIGLSLFLFASACLNFIDLGTNYEGIPLPYLLGVVLGFIGMYALSRKGYFKIASYLVIGTYLGGAIFETIKWGPELPESTMPYTLVIIMSCILIGSRIGFVATGTIGFTLIGAAFLEQTGVLHPDLAWKTEPTDISDGIEQAVIYLIIMLVSWLSAREIARSLSRARASEEALRRERDNLEETLAKRTKELRMAQAVKMADVYRFVEFGKLASGMFHDLMSPLTSVALSIEELQNKDAGTENLQISKAVSASRHIQGYMKALRRQISTHEKSERFSPHSIAKDILLLLEYKAREDKTEIVLDDSPYAREAMVYGNPLKFQQVLTNLISNGLYACKHSQKRLIRINVWEENNALRLSVSDSGCGMSAEESLHIFEPFFTTKPESEGSGLGLSITKTIIEHDFKGSISVTSTRGKGSVFTLCFPSYSSRNTNMP